MNETAKVVRAPGYQPKHVRPGTPTVELDTRPFPESITETPSDPADAWSHSPRLSEAARVTLAMAPSGVIVLPAGGDEQVVIIGGKGFRARGVRMLSGHELSAAVQEYANLHASDLTIAQAMSANVHKSPRPRSLPPNENRSIPAAGKLGGE
jgi:hypothetical protein